MGDREGRQGGKGWERRGKRGDAGDQDRAEEEEEVKCELVELQIPTEVREGVWHGWFFAVLVRSDERMLERGWF